MDRKPTRKSTQYTFMVGNVMIGVSLALIAIGLFRGIVTEHNIVEIVALLLGNGVLFFGINSGRAATENTRAMKYGRIVTDGIPPDPKLVEAEPANPHTGAPMPPVDKAQEHSDPMGAFDLPVGVK